MTAIATQVGSGKGSDDMFWGAFVAVESLFNRAKNDVDVYKKNKRSREIAKERGYKVYTDANGMTVRTEDNVCIDYVYENGDVYEINPFNGKKLKNLTFQKQTNFMNGNIQKAISHNNQWALVYKYNGNAYKKDISLSRDGITGDGNNLYRNFFRSPLIIGNRWYKISNGNVINIPYVIRKIHGSYYFLNLITLRFDYCDYKYERQNKDGVHYIFKLIDRSNRKQFFYDTVMRPLTKNEIENNLRVLNQIQEQTEGRCKCCNGNCLKGMPTRKECSFQYSSPCNNCELFWNKYIDVVVENSDTVEGERE